MDPQDTPLPTPPTWEGVAHELGNVLFPLGVAIQRLASDPSPESLQRRLSVLLSSLERLEALNKIVRQNAMADRAGA